MDEQEFAEVLAEAMTEYTQADSRSFRDAGLLTNNEGLVIRLADGSEFQVTIVRSN